MTIYISKEIDIAFDLDEVLDETSIEECMDYYDPDLDSVLAWFSTDTETLARQAVADMHLSEAIELLPNDLDDESKKMVAEYFGICTFSQLIEEPKKEIEYDELVDLVVDRFEEYGFGAFINKVTVRMIEKRLETAKQEKTSLNETMDVL